MDRSASHPPFWRIGIGLLLALAFLRAAPCDAQEPRTSLTWLGHAAFEIVTPKRKVLLIDPWLQNPKNPRAQQKGGVLGPGLRADYLLVTHGHSDHVGDSVAIAKRTKAVLVATFELGSVLISKLGFPKEQATLATLGNVGGKLSLAEGEVTVHLVPAVHSSSVEVAPGEVYYAGHPVGFVLEISGGPTIYHSGDTAYFRDMDLIGERFAPDVALLNIGGHFGMEPEQAAQAAQSLRAKLVIPHHFLTFPILTQDPKGFVGAVSEKGIPHRLLAAGNTLGFVGKKPANQP